MANVLGSSPIGKSSLPEKQVRINQKWYIIHCHCDGKSAGHFYGGNLYLTEAAAFKQIYPDCSLKLFNMVCPACGSLFWPTNITPDDIPYTSSDIYIPILRRPQTRGTKVKLRIPR